MPLTKIKSLGITDGTILGADINSTFDLTGKTVTLPAGTGGKVLQVVTATDSTQRSTTSTSFVTASNTLSVSITPTSTSNKIFIIASPIIFSPSGETIFATIFRGATNLGASNGMVQATGSLWINGTMNYLDSPSTTSATTYQVYFRVSNGTGYMIGDTPNKNSITAFEIAG